MTRTHSSSSSHRVLLNCSFFRLVCRSTQYEERDEQKEFETGPLSVLMQSVRQNTQVRQQFATRLAAVPRFVNDMLTTFNCLCFTIHVSVCAVGLD